MQRHKDHLQNVSYHQISFLSLTSAWRRSGSTVELLPPPRCLGQGDPCNTFAWPYAQEWTHHSNADISVLLFMLFLCLLLGHPRDNCVDLRLVSVHLPVATNKEPPWLIKSSLRNFNPKAANSERNFNLIHTNALKKLYLTKRQTKSSNLDQTTSLTGLTTEGDRTLTSDCACYSIRTKGRNLHKHSGIKVNWSNGCTRVLGHKQQDLILENTKYSTIHLSAQL